MPIIVARNFLFFQFSFIFFCLFTLFFIPPPLGVASFIFNHGDIARDEQLRELEEHMYMFSPRSKHRLELKTRGSAPRCFCCGYRHRRLRCFFQSSFSSCRTASTADATAVRSRNPCGACSLHCGR